MSIYLDLLNKTFEAGKRKRRTDIEFENDASEINMRPSDFQVVKNMPLSVAKTLSQAHEGVYILYLNGAVMKCGRAAYGQGIKWRFTQYYNLNYDERAQKKTIGQLRLKIEMM